MADMYDECYVYIQIDNHMRQKLINTRAEKKMITGAWSQNFILLNKMFSDIIVEINEFTYQME